MTGRNGTHFYDFYSNAFCVWLHEPDEVFRVRVTEDPERDRAKPEGYWGWWSLERGDANTFAYVYPHQTLLNMVFPYGPKVEEERGHGIRVPVKVEVLERNIPKQ